MDVSIGSNILDDRENTLGELFTPFSKWHRKDKRKFVERFCTIAIPENQNGKTKNLHLTCNCCGKSFMGQLMTAMVHLAGVTKSGQRMASCPSPNEDVKAEILHIFSGQEFHDSTSQSQSDQPKPQSLDAASKKAKASKKRRRDLGKL